MKSVEPAGANPRTGEPTTSDTATTEASLPPRYPADLERDARIRSGLVVRIRPIRPDDASALVAFHAALSAHTIYLRYFSFHPILSAAEVERFTRVDYMNRLALVVLADTKIVGVGRYDRVPDTDEAELAFIVDDDYQHQGLGTLLADDLVRAARQQGVRGFVADTLAENSGMLELFHKMGFPVRTNFDGGVVRVRFSLDDVPAYVEALARREASRSVEGSGSC